MILEGEFRSRPDAALRPKDKAAAGCHLLWLLSFGQAKESNSLVARERLIATDTFTRCPVAISIQTRYTTIIQIMHRLIARIHLSTQMLTSASSIAGL
jgi:hypothetical protein